MNKLNPLFLDRLSSFIWFLFNQVQIFLSRYLSLHFVSLILLLIQHSLGYHVIIRSIDSSLSDLQFLIAFRLQKHFIHFKGLFVNIFRQFEVFDQELLENIIRNWHSNGLQYMIDRCINTLLTTLTTIDKWILGMSNPCILETLLLIKIIRYQ